VTDFGGANYPKDHKNDHGSYFKIRVPCK